MPPIYFIEFSFPKRGIEVLIPVFSRGQVILFRVAVIPDNPFRTTNLTTNVDFQRVLIISEQ